MYCDLMEDLKARVGLVRRFTLGEIKIDSNQFAYECVSVQLRKILELIAFSSLCANKEKYSEAYADFSKHWRAKALLQALERLHPEFYPTPMKPPYTKPDGTKHLDRVADEKDRGSGLAITYKNVLCMIARPDPHCSVPLS
jgi:hypothetical protein